MSERTKQAIDSWTTREAREFRYDLIMDLALKADVITEFNQVPRIHIENMDYDKFMITIQGLAKIRELRSLNEGLALRENKNEQKPSN